MSRILTQQLVIKRNPEHLAYGTPCRAAPNGEAGQISLYAASGNTGNIWIGSSEPGLRSNMLYTLPPSRRETLWLDNIEALHYWGSASGDILEIFVCLKENY